jgi:4-hydroxybenzoate polyprenyltransferase
MGILLGLLRTARPRQWLKNLALFAPLLFSGLLFLDGYFEVVLGGVVVFTLVSSGVYIFNDIKDIEADRQHPFKMKRPIASGMVPVPLAMGVGSGLIVIALWWAAGINMFFFWSVIVYLALQVGYNLWLKQIAILDVLSIASGYILRVYAGGLIVGIHMNVWLLLTVISASLFLAVGKRKCELTLLKGSGVNTTRATLKHYTEPLLDIYTSMFANSTWLTYALYSFNHPAIIPHGKVLTFMSVLPRTLISEKLMMVTLPLVIFGVMRYLQLIYERNEGESPERVLLSDKPLVITMVVWGMVVIGLLYYIGG